MRASASGADEAQAAISLDPEETVRLARFLRASAADGHQSLVSRVLARL
jgi:hypothetical protein